MDPLNGKINEIVYGACVVAGKLQGGGGWTEPIWRSSDPLLEPCHIG